MGAAPPADRANALQSLVSRLRRVLPDPGVLRPSPAATGSRLPKENVDAHRFAALAAWGRTALASGDHRQAAACLGEAAALWRGRPLADVADAPFADAAVALLDEAWLAATEDRARGRAGDLRTPGPGRPPSAAGTRPRPADAGAGRVRPPS